MALFQTGLIHLPKNFYQFSAKFNAYCGISNLFDKSVPYYRLSDAGNGCYESWKGIRTSNSRVYFYEDYYLPAILAPRIDQMPKSNYISPVITQIREYDEKHSSDLLGTLKVYIRNLCNTSDSAKELHIHRNSLLYRINKIEELTGSALKDYDTFMHLMISFYMDDFR